MVKPLLCDSVEVKDYIVPCLHLLLGLGNDPLDHLFLIVDFFVEPLTPDLLSLYNRFETAKLAYGIDNDNTQRCKSIFAKSLKQQSKSNLPIFRQIWIILREYSIDPAQYHGGKLIGPHLRHLMQNAEEILDRIYDFISEQPNRRGPAADNDKLRDLFDRYTRMFILQDHFFSLCYSKCGTLTDADLMRGDRLVDCIMKEWRALQFSMGKPKIHGLEDHIMTYLRRFRGLFEYTEEFVEKHHQKKKRNRDRTACMRSNKKSQVHMSQQEELCNNDKVQQAHSVYNTKRKKHKLTHAPPINNNINLKQLQRTRVFRNAWHKIDDPVVPFDSWF